MTTFLKIFLVVIGVGLSAWLALVAYDLGNDFRRFTKLDKGTAGRPAKRARSESTVLTAKERADGVV